MKLSASIIGSIGIPLIIAALAFGCGEKTPPNADVSTTQKPITLIGAGATFPYPIYAQWAHTYHKVSGTKLNYQSIGSGGGIAAVAPGTE